MGITPMKITLVIASICLLCLASAAVKPLHEETPLEKAIDAAEAAVKQEVAPKAVTAPEDTKKASAGRAEAIDAILKKSDKKSTAKDVVDLVTRQLAMKTQKAEKPQRLGEAVEAVVGAKKL